MENLEQPAAKDPQTKIYLSGHYVPVQVAITYDNARPEQVELLESIQQALAKLSLSHYDPTGLSKQVAEFREREAQEQEKMERMRQRVRELRSQRDNAKSNRALSF